MRKAKPEIVYQNIHGIHYIAMLTTLEDGSQWWEGFFSETGENFQGFGLLYEHAEHTINATRNERLRLIEKAIKP